MDNELKYFLQQGPTTVKELARLTGKSTSTLYKALKADGVIEESGPSGKLFSMAPETTEDGPGHTAEQQTQETAAAGANAPTATEKRGRKASFAGKKLFPADTLLAGDREPKTYTNPRRASSHGYRSLQLIIDNPGLTTEEFVSKGGRLNDLRWDVAHSNVIMPQSIFGPS